MTYEEDEGAATHLYSPDQHPMGGDWSVNVTDDDTRTMSAVEVAYQYLQGQLDANDTYVWRDGMEDWIPLGECRELQDVIRDYQAGQPSSRPAPGPSFGSQPPASAGVYSSRPPASGPSSYGSQPPASGGAYGPSDPYASHSYASDPYASDPYGEEPFAAVRPSAARVDPFEPTASHEGAASGPAKRVGQRNEESSLFSLDALRDAHEMLGAGGAASKPAPKKPAGKKDDPLDDFFSLGSSGFGGGGFAAAFAPPPMNAPPPPPPPKPASVPPPVSSAVPAVMPMHLAQPARKSNLMLIVGIAAAVVLVAGVGLGFLIASGGDETSATAQLDGKEEESEGKSASDEDEKADEEKNGEDEEKAKDEEKEEADESKTEPKDAPAKTATGSTPAKTSTGTTGSSKDTSSSTTEKKETKKEETKEAKGGAGEFDVNAARSALSAAAGAASGCKRPGGPTGKGRVSVTFAPSGRATQAVVGPPFAGTPTGSCAAGAFKRATVPPFSGGAMTVQKSFFIK